MPVTPLRTPLMAALDAGDRPAILHALRDRLASALDDDTLPGYAIVRLTGGLLDITRQLRDLDVAATKPVVVASPDTPWDPTAV